MSIVGAAQVLVVEDDPSIQELMRLVLGGMGHAVRVAGTAEDALLLAAEQRPDLLVLDLGLPHRDGDELLELLARGIGTPRGLLVVSARPVDDVRRVARAHGAGWLTKPFDPQELEAEVTAALEHADHQFAPGEVGTLTALLDALRTLDVDGR